MQSLALSMYLKEKESHELFKHIHKLMSAVERA